MPLSDSHRAGFTLIEVIVAIAILAISLVTVMQLFSGSLRASRASCDYTRAIVHAKDRMEELSVNPVISEHVQGGRFEDGFTWEAETLPYPTEHDTGDVSLQMVKVRVSWQGTTPMKNSVELVSLRLLTGNGNE